MPGDPSEDGARFRNRVDAGRRLADRLASRSFERPFVFALPRGGVPVAFQVAGALGAPLDVLVARKIGMPGHAEFAIGAVAEDGSDPVVNDGVGAAGIPAKTVQEAIDAAVEETRRRVDHYRRGRSLPAMTGRSAILVDDGLATGATAEAALGAVWRLEPSEVVLAVPVCAAEAADRLRDRADVVCVSAPSPFRAVGLWYDDFDQVTDDEVLELLDIARSE